ncbi:MAG: PA3496 family putative envelope integrity protein [Porticoccaceae bacterium]
MDDEELDMTSDIDEEILTVEPERVRTTVISMETRRKLEDRLEKRRLEKLIRDYDFDLN